MKCCVYLLQSLSNSYHRYIGLTADLDRRLSEHNSGKSPHTSKFRPWKVVVSIMFEDEQRAKDFERYLKSGSGRAFAKKRLFG